MRRCVIRYCLKIAFLLAVFGGWLVLFHRLLPYKPKYEFATGIERQSGNFVKMEHVSDDGRELVVVDVHVAAFMWNEDRRCWNTITGKEVEETGSHDYGWKVIRALAGNNYYEHDLQYWEQFLQRWKAKKALQHKDDADQDVNENSDIIPSPFPRVSWMSQDARFFAYPGIEVPTEPDEKPRATDISIEEIANGQLIDTVPIEGSAFVLGPGAAYGAFTREGKENGNRDLVVWNLQHPNIGFTAKLPREAARAFFSDNGQLVFATCGFDEHARDQMWVWWNLSGQKLATLTGFDQVAVVDGGRTVIGFRLEDKSSTGEKCDCHVFEFWDGPTGERKGEWTVQLPERQGPAVVPYFKAINKGRYLGIDIEREIPPSFWDRHPWLAKVPFLPTPRSDSSEQNWFLVLDTWERKEVALLVVTTGTLSANNDWLATIDSDGFVKVWHFPLRRPWDDAVPFAILGTLGCWAFISMVTCILGRRPKNPIVEELAAG